MNFSKSAIFAAMLVAGAAANAGLITTGADTAFVTVANDYGTGLVQQGNTLELTPGLYDVTFKAVYKEAENINLFFSGANFLWTSDIGESFTLRLGGGPIDFTFVSSGGASVSNLQNGVNFATQTGGDFATLGLEDGSFLLAFNDASFSDTASDYIDRDYDDLIIQVSAVEVPTPGSAPLLGLGLAGIVAARRMKRNV
jgi:uncharacterized protein (TIGR03382 family)